MKRKYRNAADIFPEDLVREMQKYADGELVYIPQKEERRGWGENSGARDYYEQRNAEMRYLFRRERWCPQQLAKSYGLSTDTVRKILYARTPDEMTSPMPYYCSRGRDIPSPLRLALKQENTEIPPRIPGRVPKPQEVTHIMGKLKIGVFGAHRGMTMISQLLGNPDACVCAICDKHKPSLDAAGETAKNAGIKVELYEDFEQFIQADMDAVVLANYAHEHAVYGIRLLRSGRHIMSEVLTCANLAEAVALIEAVEETGKIYNYAENYCFFNTTNEMRRRYRAGDIGQFMYGEGEYIHDCASIWPQITYGERDHWRNRDYSTFYCTHSLGPILHMTGLRPVKVQGVEGRCQPWMRKLGATAGNFGVELVTLENGGVVKSIHGGLKREPGSINYEIYGDKGSMETDRWDGQLHIYRETGGNCVGEHQKYAPEFTIPGVENAGHGGSDFFTTHYFVRSLLGDEEAKANTIDVYEAVDMCIPGILAYRSIIGGGNAIDVPNLRLPEERDKYRHDTFCTFKEAAGEMYVSNMFAQPDQSDIPDEVYEEVRRKWLAGEPG